jgi:hypothetical protein
VIGVLGLGRERRAGAILRDPMLFLQSTCSSKERWARSGLLFAQNQNLRTSMRNQDRSRADLDLIRRVLLAAVNTTSAIVGRRRAVLALSRATSS